MCLTHVWQADNQCEGSIKEEIFILKNGEKNNALLLISWAPGRFAVMNHID